MKSREKSRLLLYKNRIEVKKMEEIFGQVANLGFPIVISIYLLVRLEGRVESLTISINELAKSIDLLCVKTPKGM